MRASAAARAQQSATLSPTSNGMGARCPASAPRRRATRTRTDRERRAASPPLRPMSSTYPIRGRPPLRAGFREGGFCSSNLRAAV